MDYSKLFSIIEEYDSIVIYRHENPDVDACGSQFGMMSWIKDNYPSKKVYAVGDEVCTQRPFPALDTVTDEILEKSLALVLDTSNEPRIDSKTYQKCKYLVKVDHHPDHEPYGDYSIVLEDYAAACEILTEAFASQKDKVFSLQTAEYLYSGLLTDTLCFSTSNTTAHTLEMASILANIGVDIPALNRILFDKPLCDFRFANYIRNHVQVIENKLAYLTLTQDVFKEFNVTDKFARSFITELGHVKEFQSWILFTEDENGKFDASIRSKTVTINDVAEKYHGGGHKNAAGANKLSKEDIDNLLKDILERL